MSASSIPFRPNARLRTIRLAAVAAAVGSAAIVLAAASPPLSCRAVVPNSAPSIRWIAPAPDAAATLARWCSSVGPAIFDARAPASSANPTADRLVLLSWNVHVGAGDVDRVVERLRRGEFTSGAPIRDYVLLLQEAYRSGDDVPAVVPNGFRPPARIAPSLTGRVREDVGGLAARHASAELFYVPSMRNGGIVRPVEDRGNAMLSTLPLADPTAIELPLERQRRVAIAASVHGRTHDGRAWTLRLVDVHLDTAIAPWRGGPFAARRRQAEALVGALADETPTLVAGDFNTWGGAHESALDVLQRAFPLSDRRPSTDGVRSPADTRPTFFGPLGFRAALDHAFARGVRTLEVRRLDDRYGSDHFPLMIQVGF